MKKEQVKKGRKHGEKSGIVSLRRCRVVHRSTSFAEAREWEILQELSMTPGQRQRVAKALKERFYGKNPPDVREAHRGR